MTSTGKAQAIGGTGTSLARRVARWIGARQQAISDHAHASADARARARGWTVTTSTGRFGFGPRAYRDPRFDARQHQDRPGGPPQLTQSARHDIPARAWRPRPAVTRKAAP
jgi:hypothetical protein